MQRLQQSLYVYREQGLSIAVANSHCAKKAVILWIGVRLGLVSIVLLLKEKNEVASILHPCVEETSPLLKPKLVEVS